MIPVSEVRAGMKGYGLTVFHGTRPERFDIRVIGVLKNFLPKQDIILIQSEDPRLLHSGIVAGMSGSPIYIEGRLAGALAYGWSFAKDALAGVTPIDSMRKELDRPLRGRDGTPAGMARARQAPAGDALAGLLPPALPTSDPLSPQLRRAALPLSVAGLTGPISDELGKAFAPYHVLPVAAGGGGRSDARPQPYEDGGAIAVQLARGDVSLAATGTVTQIAGPRVLAFGHPMFNVGEVYLPIAGAEIHTFMSALSTSFKLSSPLGELGSLIQDRQSGIVGDISERAEIIPVDLRVAVPGRSDANFHVELVRHRYLTPVLLSTVIANSVQSAASDVADATVTVKSTVKVRGYPALEMTDHAFAADGLSARTVSGAGLSRAMGELLFNNFGPVHIDSVTVHASVEYKADVAEIIGVSVGSDELEPGSRANVYVTVRPYNGAERVVPVAVEIPRGLANQQVKLVAASGASVRPEIAPPENIKQLVDNLRKSYSARSVVVSLETPDEGVTLRGRVLTDLPNSVVDTMRPGASSRRAETFKRALRVIEPTSGVITGSKELTLKVRDELPR
jgi:hypothetical protein